jgi:HEAT repeat protein
VADDPDPAVQGNVVQALASLGPQIVPHAIKALGNPKLRDLALRVLARQGPDAKDAVGPLVDAMSGADSEFRTQIQDTLAAIGPAAAPATDAMVSSLSSTDVHVQHSALFALRLIGPGAAAAKEPLLKLLQNKDPIDALAAAWALAEIAPKDADVAAKVIPVLLQGLENSNPEARVESVAALSALGSAASSAVPTLKQMAADDASPVVRAAATGAVGHITGKP